ncbi:MAG: hypothetical protein HC915_04865 [Anaerolineae bacterium]|nr:hypothetical protein [Anaerolineae bacterium]
MWEAAAQASRQLPYFGQDPVFSPDGRWLAGARFVQPEAAPPRYELWLADWHTGEEQPLGPGCNPRWSPDGQWLAYDGHSNPFWQGYTDCFRDGRVFAVDPLSGVEYLLGADVPGSLTLLGWLVGPPS